MLSTKAVSGLIIAATLQLGCGPKRPPAPPPSKFLRVTALEPCTGPADGGQPITIRGEGFLGQSRAIRVFFGDSQAQVIAVSSDTEVKIEAPAGTAGQAVDVSIAFDPGGEIKLAGGFTFTAP